MTNLGADQTAERRFAVIAGGGPIPISVVERLSQTGSIPFLFLLDGEADPVLERYPHTKIGIGHIGRLVTDARRQKTTHLTLIGTVHRRPSLLELRPSLTMLKFAGRFLSALSKGDDAILSAVVGFLEQQGFAVVGVDKLLPELIAQEGALGSVKLTAKARNSIASGIEAAHALGRLDAGQGVVMFGQRVVALEGAEGTDAMLQRVAELKRIGRLPDRKGGVLVKLSKPGQELRVDMPTTGVATVKGAIAAKLDGIAVEAGRTLIVDRHQALAEADAAKLFFAGVAVNG